jgi:hypothetical protein
VPKCVMYRLMGSLSPLRDTPTTRGLEGRNTSSADVSSAVSSAQEAQATVQAAGGSALAAATAKAALAATLQAVQVHAGLIVCKDTLHQWILIA